MKNLIRILFVVFFTQITYAQIKNTYPSIMLIGKDTLVCFTTIQAKQMAIWNEKRKECLELSKNDNQKILELNKIVTKQDSIISNLETQVIQYNETIFDKSNLINICEDEKSSLKREIGKQRRGKWIAIICGVGISLLFISI
jgi:hypothetical protein